MFSPDSDRCREERMIPAGSIRAIIFDLDGVLLLSSDIHEAAYREVLSSVGILDFDYRRFAGIRTKECLRTVTEEGGIHLSEDQLLAMTAMKSRISCRRIRSENPIASGCIQVLETLSKRFILALSSSASRETLEAFLQMNGCRSLFSCILHGGDVQEAKPSPEIYLMSCARLGLPPASCLVVEDSVAGITAAKRAGAFIYAVSTTWPVEVLRNAGADECMTRLEELLNL